LEKSTGATADTPVGTAGEGGKGDNPSWISGRNKKEHRRSAVGAVR